MLDEEYLEYIELFNERDFYECHEVLEDLWLDYFGPSREYYQGLIHLASAYLLLMRGKMRGCRARFKSTLDYLQNYPNHYLQLELEPIRANVHMWLGRLDQAEDGEVIPYVDADVPVLKLTPAGGGKKYSEGCTPCP